MKKHFKFSPQFRFRYLESWLKQMSEDGWNLSKCTFISTYIFKTNSSSVEYFLFSLYSRGRGNDSIFFLIKDNYAISEIPGASSHRILVIDPSKIDERCYYYKILRDKYIFKCQIKLLSTSVIFLLTWLIVLALSHNVMSIIWIVVSTIALLYNFIDRFKFSTAKLNN
jgi:hypothetical protein